MKNFVQDGRALTLTAPYAVLSGGGAKVGGIFGVAITSVATGEDGEFHVVGVYDLTALGTDTATVGAAAYWDDTNKRVTTTVGGNLKIGAFTQAKLNGDTTARVRLNGVF
jgi:predicted RecA/RadA family phage recombinase